MLVHIMEVQEKTLLQDNYIITVEILYFNLTLWSKRQYHTLTHMHRPPILQGWSNIVLFAHFENGNILQLPISSYKYFQGVEFQKKNIGFAAHARMCYCAMCMCIVRYNFHSKNTHWPIIYLLAQSVLLHQEQLVKMKNQKYNLSWILFYFKSPN